MLLQPQCSKRSCKHFKGVRWLGSDEDSEVPVCDAFPDGIPEVISYGEEKHEKPFPGDRGIQYERRTE